MSLTDFFQHLINGFSTGCIYALIALGYTMVYGILKFINFAHGEILMMGTYGGFYVYYFLISKNSSPSYMLFSFFIAMVVGAFISAFLGVFIERIAYRPLRRAPRLSPLLTAIGVSIILMNVASLLFGTQPRRFNYPFDNNPFSILGVNITPHQMLIFFVSLCLMFFLKMFVDKTRSGKAMRATSENMDAASLMGINVDFIISLTFAIGSALAAIAGILTALEYKLYPTMGTMAGIKAFIAAVIGGIGNIGGAMLGGILLGVLETLGPVILGIPQGLKDTIAFLLLIVVLLFKPSGILGKKEKTKV